MTHTKAKLTSPILTCPYFLFIQLLKLCVLSSRWISGWPSIRPNKNMYYLKGLYSFSSHQSHALLWGRLLFAESEQISKGTFSYFETRQKVWVTFAIHYPPMLQKSFGQFWWTWTDGEFTEFRCDALHMHLTPAFPLVAAFTPLGGYLLASQLAVSWKKERMQIIDF